MVLMLPVDVAPFQQPAHSLCSLVHYTSWFISWGEGALPTLLFLFPKGKCMVNKRDKSSLGEPHLHVELLPIALGVFHQQLQCILIATLRLLAGHLGTDVLLDLGMDDVACPQALTEQQGDSNVGLKP